MSRFTPWLAAIAMLAPTPVLAQTATLELVIGGEAYDGPPKFEVMFNGQVLGEGAVDAAIDTATAGRFADAVVKTAYLQTFAFPIPDAAFDPNGEIRLRFLNEAFGGEGSGRDRNLYVASVKVNGREIVGREMQTVSAGGVEPSAILGDYLVLLDGTADALAIAPDEGWPALGTAAAVVEAPAETPAPEAEVAVVEPAEPAAKAVEPAVATAPKVPAIETTPAAATKAAVAIESATPAPTAAAVETSAPEGVAGCALDQLYNVLGFNENSNDLTPKVTARLDQVLGDIGTEECVVSVIGYSSTVGDYATNALFAVERAQNVLAYMREHGLQVAKATATGAGETEQFGATPAANRRVVITVMP